MNSNKNKKSKNIFSVVYRHKTITVCILLFLVIGSIFTFISINNNHSKKLKPTNTTQDGNEFIFKNFKDARRKIPSNLYFKEPTNVPKKFKLEKIGYGYLDSRYWIDITYKDNNFNKLSVSYCSLGELMRPIKNNNEIKIKKVEAYGYIKGLDKDGIQTDKYIRFETSKCGVSVSLHYNKQVDETSNEDDNDLINIIKSMINEHK